MTNCFVLEVIFPRSNSYQPYTRGLFIRNVVLTVGREIVSAYGVENYDRLRKKLSLILSGQKIPIIGFSANRELENSELYMYNLKSFYQILFPYFSQRLSFSNFAIFWEFSDNFELIPSALLTKEFTDQFGSPEHINE